MDSYKRFGDDEYKNWLRTAESLYILRNNLRDFVEKETETYHSSLRDTLKGEKCVQNCIKYHPKAANRKLCVKCEKWKDAILQSYGGNPIVHWDNVEPYLWSTEKWEVAKVYMPRGQSGHRCFDQFDISAILNLMTSCKHFKQFIKVQFLTKVITLRNKVMHSPDLRLKKDMMNDGVNNILILAKHLQDHIPKLHETIVDEIQKFDTSLENYPGQVSQLEGKTENLKLLSREHQALKEKIDFLAQCYEANEHTAIKEEVQGMKNFLDQNKDLLENLGPQVNRLKEIQQTVEKHESQIDNLSNRVVNLEKNTHDPVFSGDPLKFKNHLLEQTRKRKWKDPLFSEDPEANGYRGRLVVNECTFIGTQVCNNKKSAHQEVAKIALEHFKSEFESTEEASTSAASTSSTSSLFYGTVTVFFSKNICSEGYVREDEAIESAYMKLARLFGLNDPGGGNTFRTVVLAHFDKYGVQPPSEIQDSQNDKNFCNLQLMNCLTFSDKDGATLKKKAEQQAAKVALQHLSGFLNCGSATDENYKGFLKECLDALGMDNPDYKTEKTKPTEDARSSRDAEHVSSTQPKQQEQENTNLQPKDSVTVVQPPPTTPPDYAASGQIIQTGDYSPSPTAREVTMEHRTGNLFYSTVTVVLSKDICSDGCVKEDEAIESAYMKLAQLFGLNDPGGDNTFRTEVLTCFERYGVKPPETKVYQVDKFFCNLQLMDHLTFCDTDGATLKKKAEQQAAKVALQHLSGFLNCGSAANENYKGFLKERLEALGMDKPVYKTENTKPTEDARSSSCSSAAEHISSTQRRQHGQESAILQPKDSGTVVPPPPTTPSDCAAIGLMTKAQEPNPSIPREVNMEDLKEINLLLALYNLKSPSVTVEGICTDQNFSLTMDISLDKFTFENSNVYTRKKDATCKTYYLLGLGLGIWQQNTDENQATMLVKQDFSRKSFPLPKEDINGDKEFRCFLREITYKLSYEGQGSSETEAKQDALRKALDTLPLLFGLKTLPMSSNTEKAELQMNNLLRSAQQKELTFSLKPSQHKISVNLRFNDYTMASQSQKTKKENRNLLSKRILKLLGAETEPNCPSLRNCVDDWFKQRTLQQPVFEDIEDTLGAKATFSAVLSCSHPNWKDSLEGAKKELVQELKKRFEYLVDGNEQD